MSRTAELDAAALLACVAERIPPGLRSNVVIIGSIAAAWTFRSVSGTHTVATKDIDVLLRPAVDAVTTAQALAKELQDEGWHPRFPGGVRSGTHDTPDDQLPALRLSPPDNSDGWFMELLAEPTADQTTRKHWRRFHTAAGDFGLPSFRYLPVAVHDAPDTEFGLRVARPSNMALAHLLEHADPDHTPISGLPGSPPRFTKDVGRAVALWWLAREQSSVAGDLWLTEWRQTLTTLFPGKEEVLKQAAAFGIAGLGDHLRSAHEIAVNGVLAPHATTLDAFRRAHAGLTALIGEL